MNHDVEVGAGGERLLRQDIVMPITVLIVMKKWGKVQRSAREFIKL